MSYYEWLYTKVCRNEMLSFNKLFKKLNSIPFTYIIDQDVNRMCDGIHLRYLYGYETNTAKAINLPFDESSCSVLEMLVALAIRYEDEAYDPDYGDRTNIWFWDMLKNLKINHMDDRNYSEKEVEEKIDIFLNRKYDYDGENGNVFVLKYYPPKDMRTTELWYQLCWVLNERDEEE